MTTVIKPRSRESLSVPFKREAFVPPSKCGTFTWAGENRSHQHLYIKAYCKNINECQKCREFWVESKLRQAWLSTAIYRVVLPYIGKEQTSKALEMMRRRTGGEYLWLLKVGKGDGEMQLVLYLRGIGLDVVAEEFKRYDEQHVAAVQKIDQPEGTEGFFTALGRDLRELVRFGKRKRIFQPSRGFFLPIVKEVPEFSGFMWKLVAEPIGWAVRRYARTGGYEINELSKQTMFLIQPKTIPKFGQIDIEVDDD